MEAKKKNEDKIQAKLREFYAKLQELEAKAKELRADLDDKIGEQVVDLKEKNAKVHDTFQDLKFSSSAAFHDIRDGFEKAADALREAIRKASHHFKN